jgi:PAS domain S-box-containing protein
MPRAYALALAAAIVGLVETARGARRRERERREILHAALRTIGDAVATTDAAGAITTMNAAAESLAGWTESEALGRPVDAVFRLGDERTWQAVESPAASAIRHGSCAAVPAETALVARTGHRCDVEGSATAIRDDGGRISGCVLVLRDVTERRRRERDQAGQLVTARLLAAIVESSEDAIITTSLDGTIQTWNTAAERLYGFPAVHAIGRHVSLVIPTERLAEDDALVTCLAAGEHIDRLETDWLHGDGRRLRVTLTMSPLRDPAGRVVGVSRIVGGVCPRRSAERQERDRLARAAAATTRFQDFFEQATSFGAVLDPHGTVLEINRRASSGYGYARDQIVDRAFWDGPWCGGAVALAARVRRACLHAAAGRTVREAVAFTAADGTARHLDLTIVPIVDDDGRIRYLAPVGVEAPPARTPGSDGSA